MKDLNETYMKHLMDSVGISMDTWNKYSEIMNESEEDEDNVENGDEKDESLGLEDNQVSLYGPIVSDDMAEIFNFFGIKNFVSPRQVKERLADMDGDIEIRINSPGGSIIAAAAICNTFDEYDKGRISATIEGISASAATMVQMCADDIAIAKWGSVMIHRSSGLAMGNGEEIEQYGLYMQDFDDLAAKQYAERGKKTKEEFYEMMRVETWLLADAAKKVGLVDSIVSKKKAKAKDAKNAINKIDENAMAEINNRAFAFMELFDE